MVRRGQCERSVWVVLLSGGDHLWRAALRQIDDLLHGEALIEIVGRSLRGALPAQPTVRSAGDAGRGRGPDAVLKRLYRWSSATLEQEVWANLLYRAFGRVAARMAFRMSRRSCGSRAVGPEVIAALHTRAVKQAVAAKLVAGRRLRIDPTVVETNAHHRTGSSLLVDGVRVLTRMAAAAPGRGAASRACRAAAVGDGDPRGRHRAGPAASWRGSAVTSAPRPCVAPATPLAAAITPPACSGSARVPRGLEAPAPAAAPPVPRPTTPVADRGHHALAAWHQAMFTSVSRSQKMTYRLAP
jgi:hypothetical protein